MPTSTDVTPWPTCSHASPLTAKQISVMRSRRPPNRGLRRAAVAQHVDTPHHRRPPRTPARHRLVRMSHTTATAIRSRVDAVTCTPRRDRHQPPTLRADRSAERSALACSVELAFNGESDRMTMTQRSGRRGMAQTRRVARSDSRGIRGGTELPQVRVAGATRSGDWFVGPSCHTGSLGGDRLRGQPVASARVTPGHLAIGMSVEQRHRRRTAPRRPSTVHPPKRHAAVGHRPPPNPRAQQRRPKRARQGQRAAVHGRAGAVHFKARDGGAGVRFRGRRVYRPGLRPHGCTVEHSLAAVGRQRYRTHFMAVWHRHASLRASAARAGDHR
jgi:hypothetical protein